MKSKLTFEWELTGMDGQKGIAFSKDLPCRKIPGLYLADTANLHAICAFNPSTGETMSVLKFRTASNVYYGGWYNKVKQGWTLVKEYKHLGTLTLVTPVPTPVPAPVEDEDDYWG